MRQCHRTHERKLIRLDATIRYWTGGPDTALTLVLLHGATLHHRAWGTRSSTP